MTTPATALRASRTQALLHGRILPTILRLSTPNVLGLAASTAIIAWDGYIIGLLGSEALAGAALVFPISMLMLQMSNGALGGSINAVIARALGAADNDSAERLSQHAVVVAERILNAVRLPYEVTTDLVAKARVEIGVSVGVAVMPDHGEDAEAATKSADIAMYYSKEAGKNRVTVYDESLNTKSNELWRVEQDIRSALVKGEFELHYQPIVAPAGKLLGVEALIRWRRAGETFMSPSTFIPIAEQNGMIIPLGSWVFRRVFIDLRRLERSGFGRFYFSINVSSKQFEQFNFVSTLSDAIDKAGVDASRINLELTETTLMSNANEAVAKILEIKRRYPAIMLSIDDFGTGYSSLSYLSRLPVDVLKIDISFVRALHDEQNRKIVNSILSLAESLGIHVVAEGIETCEQRNYFRERNAYGLQGWLFMKAQPVDELERRFLALREKNRLAVVETGTPSLIATA